MSAHLCRTLRPVGDCYRCDLSRDEVTADLLDRLRSLLTYMSDHGGGETYPNGDCPDDQCPSCEARELLQDVKGVVA